jgi:hypothetical protein
MSARVLDGGVLHANGARGWTDAHWRCHGDAGHVCEEGAPVRFVAPRVCWVLRHRANGGNLDGLYFRGVLWGTDPLGAEEFTTLAEARERRREWWRGKRDVAVLRRTYRAGAL